MSTQDTTTVPYLDFHDGHRIPQLGFGVFQVPPEDTAEIVTHALNTGYRSIDTAAAYQNERGVGEAVRGSDLPREEVFVTTKLWNSSQGRDRALRAFEKSLERLGLDCVDLYLIHWPVPAEDKYVETWQALCELKADGRARSIGVSNFLVEHLERIIEATGEVPVINQIELHPRLPQAELRQFHSERGILTEAWSPLAQGDLLEEPRIRELSAQHDRAPAQVILRWHFQLGNVVIPKSVTPARVQENFRIFDFELSPQDMEAIAELDTGERMGPDPATFNLT